MNIPQLAAALRSFSFERETIRIVEENKNVLADLQAEQWAQGRNINGQPIELIDNPEYGYGYRPYTVEEKKKNTGLGAVTSYVTNYMSGELYRSLFEEIKNSRFTLKSNISYFGKLMKRENNAEGLDEESRRTFGNDVYLPALKSILKSKTGVEF